MHRKAAERERRLKDENKRLKAQVKHLQQQLRERQIRRSGSEKRGRDAGSSTPPTAAQPRRRGQQPGEGAWPARSLAVGGGSHELAEPDLLPRRPAVPRGRHPRRWNPLRAGGPAHRRRSLAGRDDTDRPTYRLLEDLTLAHPHRRPAAAALFAPLLQALAQSADHGTPMRRAGTCSNRLPRRRLPLLWVFFWWCSRSPTRAAREGALQGSVGRHRERRSPPTNGWPRIRTAGRTCGVTIAIGERQRNGPSSG